VCQLLNCADIAQQYDEVGIVREFPEPHIKYDIFVPDFFAGVWFIEA
jgi:hypothetical protein